MKLLTFKVLIIWYYILFQWITFFLSSTNSLHKRHFLTRAEHWWQTVIWPHGRNNTSRLWSEHTIHSSKHFSSTWLIAIPSPRIKFCIWLLKHDYLTSVLANQWQIILMNRFGPPKFWKLPAHRLKLVILLSWPRNRITPKLDLFRTARIRRLKPNSKTWN